MLRRINWQAYLYRPLSNRLRLRDYTPDAAANQLDDGIGDTFVLGLWYEVRPSLLPYRDRTSIWGPCRSAAVAASVVPRPSRRYVVLPRARVAQHFKS